MTRFSVVLLVAAGLVPHAFGDVTVVDEKFDSYADDAALISVWVPRIGSGVDPAPTTDAGILTTDATLFPGIQGKAVDHVGGAINQYEPAMGGPSPGSPLIPSDTQHVFVSVDFFDGASGNERITLGLRNRTVPPAQNIIEMGLYNSNSCDPTVDGCGATTAAQNSLPDTPGFYQGTAYATRTQLINGFNPPLVTTPDWQYYQLPDELDRPDPVDPLNPTPQEDTDMLVNIADIGAGWHRYAATIAPDSVTYTIDLFRDGFRNNMRDANGVVVGAGEAGVADATMTFPVNFFDVGFDSLRIGGPSGIGSAGAGATGFDNILVKLVDVVTPGGSADFNGNGMIDAADYVLWRNNEGSTTGTQATGDANGDTNVNQADYDIWRATFGSSVSGGAALGAAAAVPEPSSIIMASLGLIALFGASRARKRR
jgi:hypothetical protein